MPIPLASSSALRKLSESQTSDSSPAKAVSERTRKKTNANEITDVEWIVVNTRLAEGKDRLTNLHVKGEKKSEIEEMMEEYVARC